MYNAWLAQLIERGQVTGLVLDTRWNNVLFDLLVSGLGKLFSLQVTEKIAVSMCVLIFFWGAFALVSAASERIPWFLAPLLAMVAYGYTFHMGFFNYYLSLGLAFFGIAIFWRGKKWKKADSAGPCSVDFARSSSRPCLDGRSHCLHCDR